MTGLMRLSSANIPLENILWSLLDFQVQFLRGKKGNAKSKMMFFCFHQPCLFFFFLNANKSRFVFLWMNLYPTSSWSNGAELSASFLSLDFIDTDKGTCLITFSVNLGQQPTFFIEVYFRILSELRHSIFCSLWLSTPFYCGRCNESLNTANLV